MRVVVGIIENAQQQILIALRPPHVHQGNLWEFPGGKVTAGETAFAALKRELEEEVNIQVLEAVPWLSFNYAYADKKIFFDVWKVTALTGMARGCEGQSIEWVDKSQLKQRAFPAANLRIISALMLPTIYWITPELEDNLDQFLQKFKAKLIEGVRLIQLRLKTVSAAEYEHIASQCLSLCQEYQAELILNAPPEILNKVPAAGIHLTSERLRQLRHRPLATNKWLAASCHNETEIQQAVEIGVDFITLSPVQPTVSHPEIQPLGWERFAALAQLCPFSVYALGGMTQQLLPQALKHKAQGIAGIRLT